jgi:curved DNA-binding protein
MQQRAATSFTDYYEILQLNQNADQETIERVYRLLAKKYHPDSVHSGDVEKFRNLTEAFRILSDPVKRASYDATYDKELSERLQGFYDQLDIHEPYEDRKIQRGILSLLYSARRRDAVNPGVGMYEMERLLRTPEKHLEFHLWYLKEKGWIQRIESGQLAITASGVDEAMKNGNHSKKHQLLTSGRENEHEIEKEPG